MNSKKVNRLFLTIILINFAVVAFLLFMGNSITLDIITNLLISEGMLFVPALVFLLLSGKGKKETLGFHKIRISTALMTILFTFLIMPLVTVLNTISMFFAENAVASLQSEVMDMPFVVMLFMIGIFGPFCEEFVFRGVIYGGYLKSGNKLGAILLSALLFGLMHLNANQAIYAFAIGIALALLKEAAGSLLAPMVCHMAFNSEQVCLMYLSNMLLAQMPELADSTQITNETLLASLSVYLVVAAVMTPIAVCVLVWIAKNEKREGTFHQIWASRRERKEYLVSIPLIIAVVLCLAYMSLEWLI
jgi:membrane protease YdiL (CAAX protease family)